MRQVKKPKKKCCTSKPHCTRCPIRLLNEGQLPPGFTVRRRRLVKVKGKVNGAVPDVMVSNQGKRKKNKKKAKRAKAAKVELAA